MVLRHGQGQRRPAHRWLLGRAEGQSVECGRARQPRRDVRRKGEPERAVADLNRALDLDPNDASAWYNRGIAYDDLGDRDHAIADYTRAIRLEPNDALYYNNRGNSLIGKNDYEHAMADYDRAIRLDREIRAGLLQPRHRLARASRSRAGIADLDMAIKLDPNYGPAYGRARDLPRQGRPPTRAGRFRQIDRTQPEQRPRHLCARQHVFRRA